MPETSKSDKNPFWLYMGYPAQADDGTIFVVNPDDPTAAPWGYVFTKVHDSDKLNGGGPGSYAFGLSTGVSATEWWVMNPDFRLREDSVSFDWLVDSDEIVLLDDLQAEPTDLVYVCMDIQYTPKFNLNNAKKAIQVLKSGGTITWTSYELFDEANEVVGSILRAHRESDMKTHEFYALINGYNPPDVGQTYAWELDPDGPKNVQGWYNQVKVDMYYGTATFGEVEQLQATGGCW